IGGVGIFSGIILVAGDSGPIKIAHDVLGGEGDNSGQILHITDNHPVSTLAGVAIGGSLVGGSGNASGGISSASVLGPVTITSDLRGGTPQALASLDRSGFIRADGRIVSVAIGGSILAGEDNSTGAV